MKIEKLSKKDLEYIKSTYYNKSLSYGQRIDELIKFFGKSERTVRRYLVSLGFKEKQNIESEQFKKAKEKKFDKRKKCFIITWAQNSTPVHDGFLKNIEAYAEYINASIHCICGRYNNQNQKLENNTPDTWDKKIEKYLDASRHHIHKHISILADIKIQPTAVSPLTSLESLTENSSAIVGHPRVHMKSMPVIDVEHPKMLFSTGSITKPNFTDSRSGRIGEFHFVYGFVVVEIKDDETYFIRQVTADSNGDFNDLYFNVKNGNISRIDSTLALIKGDLHYGSHDEKVLERSFSELIPKIKPEKIFLHDIFDGISVNPHITSLSEMYFNEIHDKNNIKKEINVLLEFLNTIKHYNLYVVFSNHDDFLTRFINNGDVKKNIKNAVEYMEYGKILLEGNAPKGIIPYIINNKFPKIKCLGKDESFKVKGWECSMHGHYGSNGSKGSVQQFRKLNTKTITAHGHGAFRFDGAVQVGTNSKLKLNYTQGPSCWVHADAIIHNDGKCQLIIFSGPDREYTTFE